MKLLCTAAIIYTLDHRLPKLKSRLFDVFLRALRAGDSTYVVYATACVYREMYGKITDSLKSGKFYFIFFCKNSVYLF